MQEYIKLVKSLENSRLLLEGVSETIKNAGKANIRGGDGTARVFYGSKRSSLKKNLIPSHPY